MGIRNIISRLSKRFTLKAPPSCFVDWLSGGSEASAGVKVNESSALKYTPFWSAVRIISGTIASLPFKVYSRLEKGGKEPLYDHPVYKLIHDRPNPYMDALTFIETRQAHLLTYGNGYAEIQRDGAGRPIALWPLMPNRTARKIKDDVPYYEVRLPTGGSVNLPDKNVLHIKGLGFDGYMGYPVVALHKEAIGYGVAVKEYGSRFFGTGANPGGIYEHPKAISDTARKHLRESLELEYGGLSKAHRLMILEEGLKWTKTGVDPEQAQALETQKYTVDDCSRIFCIPPHKLGSLERATFSNIEEQNIDFYAMTMMYWFRKWELECNYKLFTPKEQGKLFCAIVVEGMLRGKTITRFQAYNIARNAGFMCVDDIRELENMNPLPDGKGQIFLEPLNMKEVGGDNNNDAVRKAHRDMITGQWLRIITKQNNAVQKVIKRDFYENHRDYAKRILFYPVHTWASMHPIGMEEVRHILDKVINENINQNVQLTESDAEKLAEIIIEKIGGNHNALRKGTCVQVEKSG